ncbi:DNA replication and repair protein RecF [Aliiroseovarius sediminilitoris]|uniref:DNA replication and repair protein RecF n=1 Tax=Aliiroseovarius sediminilitoris TaxID=1173584 RepID=A0A1I0MYI5_9RHOB|nr:DNA replication/repair protein RecF [Aliiroseovarius sediminilitoris]SEV93155.1 DNA replication and repair protein RecF [Aliiroseovarius sediminilitoris]
MLALRELTLSHFRSHRIARLSLDGRPVAIHGRNGAGKTNILEAISMLSPGRGLRRATADEMIRRPEGVGWKVTAILQSLHQIHEVETWIEQGGVRQVRIDGKSAPQVALGRIARMVWLVPVMDRLWVEGADGRRRFLDRMTMSFKPHHADTVLTYEKAMRERNRLLKDGQRDGHWYDALEAQMARAAAEMTKNRNAALSQLIAAQAEAETAFPAAELSLIQPDEAELPTTEEGLAQAFAESRPRDLLAGRTLVGPHRTDLAATYSTKGIAARDCSTGEQKALLVSLILANSRALTRDFGAPPILLLDEVAAHLDAGRRAALYDEVCALGAQAFMTGTGPELFAELGNRASHIEVSEADGRSHIEEVTI